MLNQWTQFILHSPQKDKWERIEGKVKKRSDHPTSSLSVTRARVSEPAALVGLVTVCVCWSITVASGPLNMHTLSRNLSLCVYGGINRGQGGRVVVFAVRQMWGIAESSCSHIDRKEQWRNYYLWSQFEIKSPLWKNNYTSNLNVCASFLQIKKRANCGVILKFSKLFSDIFVLFIY